VTYELGNMWMEVVRAYLKVLSSIYLQGLKKIMKNLSQESQSPGQELDLEVPNIEQKCSPLNHDVQCI
jgi:hypothetical protein